MANSKLLSPYTIKDTVFRNRIVVSPMCQYSSADGFATDWHLVHLGSRATGGAGLIMQEATAVSPEGRITYGDLGIWKEEHIPKLRQIVRFLHDHGAKAGIQLAHAGRKASCKKPWNGGAQIPAEQENGWTTVSVGREPFREGQEAPVALDEAGIQRVIADFVQATRRAKAVGYDVVEVHAAHGYLLHQFLSPLTNRRTDAYGGSFENRIRLVLEITAAVKQEWGAGKPLFVRISATDWTDGGWNIEDSIQLAGRLKALGVDLIDTSSGGNVPHARIPAEPGYQTDFADRIRNEAGIATGAVGLITSPQQAEDILKTGKADLIFLARESLRNPNFPLYAAFALGDTVAWPQQYERAQPGMHFYQADAQEG
ncbi:NADH:flavin oxidoreductase/NADH oxidase [Flavilitoribacter nigricans]|uniref:Oxidoreductase n=1 Tax=Flavilitoribacter nigricans (strain ATCC 23147 / DSM 23189 / NBRC 102662 / NCIMB 1420 / SS-2) TaxID=1122177 RepID=A0A2D0NL34_FLAN2|nr:NADH:flavin oxidoreductase/NADH oxidase [Flavilitoribacter nigricans]PHN08453.1 oxidoreductase [Flavilitoribacter nigricans DSM 23189 = NBRC 102662]